MTRRVLIIALLILVPAAAAPGAERFALPQFKGGYERPATEVPPARAGAYDYVDVAALGAVLAAASYLALVARSRRGLWLVMLGSLLYFGFWRGGCVCSIGALQNASLALADPAYAIPAVVVLFLLLPLVATLFFGRTFCAAVCPLGAIQDLVAVHPVRVPAWLEHALGLLAYVYLGAAVLFAATGAAFLICEYDPFVSFFRLVPVLRPQVTMTALSGSRTMLLVGAAFLAVGLVVARPYCRYLCPLGAVLRLLSRAAKWHVTITPEECLRCRLCEDSCPFGAIRRPSADEPRLNLPVEKRRLALLVLAVPVLAGLGGALVASLAGPLARMHYTVEQAERVRQEQDGHVEGSVDLSEAFHATGRPAEALYAEADAVRARFATGGWLLGGWIGLVIGGKLVHLSVRRTRTDFEPDRGTCLSCGRCFAYCPVERQRQKSKSPAAQEATPPGAPAATTPTRGDRP